MKETLCDDEFKYGISEEFESFIRSSISWKIEIENGSMNTREVIE